MTGAEAIADIQKRIRQLRAPKRTPVLAGYSLLVPESADPRKRKRLHRKRLAGMLAEVRGWVASGAVR